MGSRSPPSRGPPRDPPQLLAFALGAVLGPGLLAVRNALGIQDAADDVVADTGQVADAAASNENDGVFLEVVPLARNVCRHFDAVGEPNARHLAQRRVRLLGRHDFHLKADTLFLWAAVQRRVLRPAILLDARFTYQLVNRRHSLPRSALARSES